MYANDTSHCSLFSKHNVQGNVESHLVRTLHEHIAVQSIVLFTCANFSCVRRLTKEEKKQQKEEERKEKERKKLEKEKEKERKKREEARMKNRLKGLKAFKVLIHTFEYRALGHGCPTI